MKKADPNSDQNPDDLVPVSARQLAAVGASAGNVPNIFLRSPTSGKRFWEFFTANIRNRNTRRAYFIAVSQFSHWCEQHKLELEEVQPIHVAAYIEHLMLNHSKPTVKQHLAGIRMLFDWLVTGQIIATNPAHSVRGPRHSVKKGKTAVLSAEEMRTLLDSIDTSTLIGLRDRALIALMGYTFARIGAVAGSGSMKKAARLRSFLAITTLNNFSMNGSPPPGCPVSLTLPYSLLCATENLRAGNHLPRPTCTL